MQVTCPNCAARYAVDPLAIGPAGRTVQCARCHERWFQSVERGRAIPDVVIRPSVHGVSLPAVIKSRPPVQWRRYIPVAAVALAAVVAAILFVFRGDIVALLSDDRPATMQPQMKATAPAPPAAQAATTAAAGSRPAPAQLAIDLAASKIELVDGRYVVRGDIVNNGGAPGTTKTLKIVFKSPTAVLGNRGYPLALGPIAPGGRIAFAQALDEPPAGTTDIVPEVE